MYVHVSAERFEDRAKKTRLYLVFQIRNPWRDWSKSISLICVGLLFLSTYNVTLFPASQSETNCVFCLMLLRRCRRCRRSSSLFRFAIWFVRYSNGMSLDYLLCLVSLVCMHVSKLDAISILDTPYPHMANGNDLTNNDLCRRCVNDVQLIFFSVLFFLCVCVCVASFFESTMSLFNVHLPRTSFL